MNVYVEPYMLARKALSRSFLEDRTISYTVLFCV
jgi:hypothetical protein